MKEIRVFASSNNYILGEEVNDFIRSTEYEVCDIQYGVGGGLFSTEYSAMVIIEVNDKENLSET